MVKLARQQRHGGAIVLLSFVLVALASSNPSSAASVNDLSVRSSHLAPRLQAPGADSRLGFVYKRQLSGLGGLGSSSDSSSSNGGSSSSSSDDPTTGGESSTTGGSSTGGSSSTSSDDETATSRTSTSATSSSTTSSSSSSSSSSSTSASTRATTSATSSGTPTSSSSTSSSPSSSATSSSSTHTSSHSLSTSTDASGSTIIVTSYASASASATTTAASDSDSSTSSNHTPLIIGVSVVGGVALLGGLIFFLTRFIGKRNGFDDDNADIKWPELKHAEGDVAAMQPLPARRTGGAGFDMGDEFEDTASVMGTEIGAGAGAAGVAGSAYGGSKARDSFSASTTHLTGAGAFGAGHQDISPGSGGYYDQYPAGGYMDHPPPPQAYGAGAGYGYSDAHYSQDAPQMAGHGYTDSGSYAPAAYSHAGGYSQNDHTAQAAPYYDASSPPLAPASSVGRAPSMSQNYSTTSGAYWRS